MEIVFENDVWLVRRQGETVVAFNTETDAWLYIDDFMQEGHETPLSDLMDRA